MIEFTLNGQAVRSEADSTTPLLWVIRDELGLKGTKYGGGIAQCGACTVHVGGRAVRSCALPVVNIAGQSVTTIEGLAGPTHSAAVLPSSFAPSRPISPAGQALPPAAARAPASSR